jgi:photosystem II stability/assembly factor-like uncharacterized protein
MGELYEVAFVGPRRGWLFASSGTWQTDDAGITWQKLLRDGRIPTIGTAGHGWLLRDGGVDQPGWDVYTTSDNGRTWTECQATLGEGFRPTENASFVASSSAWSIAIKDRDPGLFYGVAHTIDGGCKWELVWKAELQDPDEHFSDIYFLNDREGWLAGDANGSLYRTTNSGRSWQRMPKPSPCAKITNVFFKSPQLGWVVAKRFGCETEGVFQTSDGGSTWRPLSSVEIIGVPGQSIPSKWAYGQLLRMLYSARQRDRTQETTP